MLVWWHKSIYEINYSHFFSGGWQSVLKWCNVRAHKIIISASTIDFRPTLKYKSTSADLQQQCLTSFCAVCGVLFYYKRESTVVSSGVRDVTLMTHICSHSAECLYATFSNQTWYCGAPPWAGMSCEKMGFYLQVQGHSVSLYNHTSESFATKLNLMVDHHKQRRVQWKYWIVVFKVNVTAKVKSFS